MKILQIVPSYKPAYVYGGPIESVAKLCEGLAAKGHTVHVFTTTANGETELDVVPNTEMNVEGVMVTYFKRITKDHTHISPDLWKQLNATVKQYDIVHIQSWWSILVIVAAVICHWKGAKVIISPRGMLSDYILNSTNSKIKKAIHAVVGKSALKKSYFHATAESEYAECRQIIKGWQGFVQPNILSLPDIPISKNVNPIFSLIFLSRIHPKKGLEGLFEAISKLDMEVTLKIAGSGETDYIDSLKDLAIKLGIQDKIQWLGWMNREQKFIELMQADLFVLVSQNENFANVVVESLHMGTPVLVSKEVALSDFVTNNNMGWVTDLGSENIRTALSQVYSEKDRRLKIQESGRQIINQFFSADKLIYAYEKEYEKILTIGRLEP